MFTSSWTQSQLLKVRASFWYFILFHPVLVLGHIHSFVDRFWKKQNPLPNVVFHLCPKTKKKKLEMDVNLYPPVLSEWTEYRYWYPEVDPFLFPAKYTRSPKHEHVQSAKQAHQHRTQKSVLQNAHSNSTRRMRMGDAVSAAVQGWRAQNRISESNVVVSELRMVGFF